MEAHKKSPKKAAFPALRWSSEAPDGVVIWTLFRLVAVCETRL